MLSGFLTQPSLGQGKGAVPLPPAKPTVDQLGQMEGVTDPDRTGLAVFLFLQVIATLAVALAIWMHLSLPGRKKKKSSGA